MKRLLVFLFFISYNSLGQNDRIEDFRITILSTMLSDTYIGEWGFSALIDYVKKGIIKKNQNVIFIFTGGGPAVVAYNKEIANSEKVI